MSRAGAALRPIDLARMVGCSTQQIRNYADAGILPPTPRTRTGYRRFEASHRRALITFRALASGYGIDIARRIMVAIHDADLPAALTLVNACHADLEHQRVSLQAAGEALETVAKQEPESLALSRSGMRIAEAARYLGVRTSALRVWESAGLLIPGRETGTRYRRFTPADLRDAQMIKMLRQSRYGLPQIRPILDGLRQTGSSAALRAAIAQRHEVLIERSTVMLAGSSYLHHYVRNEEPSPCDQG